MKKKIRFVTYELRESLGIVNEPKTIVNKAMKLDNGYQETLWLYGLNASNNILIEVEICRGAYNKIIISPREIFTPLLLNNCGNFILVHNHPSGEITPSEEDTAFTKKIQKASKLMGFHLLDHLIITADKNKYFSFKKDGLL